MAGSSLTRRIFPYVLIVCGGFVLALAVTYFFILPDSSPEEFATTTDAPRPSPRNHPDSVSVEDIMPDVQAPELPPDEPPDILMAPVIVPDLVGKDLWEAQQTLDRLRFTVIIRRDTSSFELPNTVVRQTPLSGQRMFPNDTVYITISQFPPAR